MRKVLERIGLTRGESEVYLTLVKTGNTTSGKIIKESGVSRSKVYEVLERLKQKGLATEVRKDGVRHFEATSPEKIKELLRKEKAKLAKRESEAEDLIPELVKLQKTQLEKQEARVYTGLAGWKTLFNEILNDMTEKDEYLAFGVGIKEVTDPRVARFFRQFHLKRAKKKIKAHLIMRPEMRPIMEKSYADLDLYYYKYLDMKFPTNINIHKDRIIMLVWGENPLAFLIKSKQLSDQYRAFFKEMWEGAVD